MGVLAVLLMAALAQGDCPTEVRANGSASELLASLDAVAKGCPEPAPVLRQIVARAVEVGEYGLAIKACSMLAASAGPLAGADLLACARPHAVRGELRQARDLLDAYVHSRPDDRLQALLKAADVMEGAYRFDAAAELLAQAVAAAPTDQKVVIRFVHSLLQAGQPEQAATAALQAANRAGEGRTLVLREACRLMVRFRAASAARPLALALAESSPLTRDDLEAVAAVADVLREPEMARRAATRFAEHADESGLREAAQTLERHSMEAIASQFLAAVVARGGSPEDRFRLGRLQLVTGKVDKAMGTFREYLQVRKAPDAYVRVAEEWMKARKPDQAVIVLRAGLDEGVESLDMVLALGQALREAKDEGAEVAAYAAAARRSKDPADVWLKIGEGLMGQQRPATARAAFSSAAEAASSSTQRAMALCGIAEAAFEADRQARDKAEQSLLAALEAAPDDSSVLDRVSKISERIGASPTLAMAVLERNVKRFPARSDLWARLASGYVAGHRRTEALNAYGQMVRSAQDRKAALVSAIEALVKARWYGEAVKLLQDEGMGEPPTQALAETLGQACVTIHDRGCAVKYIGHFLNGPVQLDYDYLALAQTLMDAKMWGLAANAIETARKAAAKEWLVECAQGRLELLRGRLDAAEGHFRRGLELAPQRRPTLLRVANEYRQAERLTRAAAWYGLAMQEEDPAFRAQVFPAYAEVMWRLGRQDDLRRSVASLDGVVWRNPRQLAAAASQLAAAGLWAEAVALLERGMTSAPPREKANLAGMQVALLVRLGRSEEALRVASARCGADPGPNTDTDCLTVAARLAAALEPKKAAEVLMRRAAASAGAQLHAQLAVLLLRLGRKEEAMASAMRAAETASTPAEVISTVGTALADLRAWDEWAAVIQHMAARSQFAGEPDLLFEAGRAHLNAGRLGGAMLAFQAYMGAVKAGEVKVYRELAQAGARDEAARVIEAAPPLSLAAADPADLEAVLRDLLTYGRRDLAAVVAERFKAGSERAAQAGLVLARIYERLGLHGEAVAAFKALLDVRLAPDDRVAFFQALWATGARAEALDVVQKGVRGADVPRGDSPIEQWIQQVVDFLVAEDAIGETLALLERVDRELGLPAQSRILYAKLLVQSGRPEAIMAGRLALAHALMELPDFVDDVAEYVKAEAATSDLRALRAMLAGYGNGRAVVATRLLAACLAGDDVKGEVEAISGPSAAPDPDGMGVAAKVLFSCGRFEAAMELGLKALAEVRPGEDPTPLGVLVVKAARLSGAQSPGAKVEERISAATDDQVRRLLWLVKFRLETNDLEGGAKAALKAAQAAPADPEAYFVAVESALWAGLDVAAAEKGAVENSDDKGLALERLVDLYRRYLREDLALPHSRTLANLFPGDRSMAWRVFELAVRGGLFDQAREAGRNYVTLLADKRSAAAEVASYAATQLATDVAKEFMPRDMGQSGPAAQAAVQLAIMHYRRSEPAEGERMMKYATEVATDPTGVLSLAGQAALVDPDVPLQVISAVTSVATKGVRDQLPYVLGARCTASLSSDEDARKCTKQLLEARLMPASILMAGAYKALAERRYDAAMAMMRELLSLEAGRGVRLHMASRVMSYLGCGSMVNREVRGRMGGFALSLIEPPVPGDESSLPLRAHLTEMAKGLDAGARIYESQIRLDPADSSLRNNIAYLLSLCGGDLKRAVREARLAEVLNPKGNGYYVETEAWAEFLAGRKEAALDLELRARRFWNLGQGGGLAESFYHLGRIYEALGRTAEAVEAYRRAATLEPEEGDARAAIGRWREIAGGAQAR